MASYFFCQYIFQNVCASLTVDPGDGPVAADDGGMKRQLEDEGTDIGIGICVHSRDVDRVHVRSFTDLSIVRNE